MSGSGSSAPRTGTSKPRTKFGNSSDAFRADSGHARSGGRTARQLPARRCGWMLNHFTWYMAPACGKVLAEHRTLAGVLTARDLPLTMPSDLPMLVWRAARGGENGAVPLQELPDARS